MNDMNNDNFSKDSLEFEMPITAGQILNNLLNACTKGFLLYDPDFNSQNIKSIFGYTKLEVFSSENSSLYHMYNFESKEHEKYLMSTSLKYMINKDKIYQI